MAFKSAPSDDARSSDDARVLGREVRVSDSGQFTVSMETVRKLDSFRRNVVNIARIREKLHSKR